MLELELITNVRPPLVSFSKALSCFRMTASVKPPGYFAEKESDAAADDDDESVAAVHFKPRADPPTFPWEFDMEITTGQLVRLSN